jgi:predicted N-acyltransferase
MHANGIGTSTGGARVSMLELQTAGDVGLVAIEPRASVAAPAAGYAISLFETSAEIDRAGWQKVCAGASTFMDLRFLAAVEAGMKPACQFRFAMVYDGDEPVACAGITAMQVDFTDFGDPRVSWLVKYNPLLWRFRRMKMLFCSLPGSPGDRSLVIAPGADSARVLALLDEQMVRIAHELRLDAIVYKEFMPDHIRWMDPLLAHGYARVEIPPMHVLDPAFSSFSAYCAALRTRYRQQVTKSTRKLKDSGITTTVLTDPDEIMRLYTRDTHAMYVEMTLKSDLRIEVLPYEYYRELVRAMPDRVELVSLIKDDRIVGFGWCLNDGDTYHMMYAGIDYAINRQYDLYFNLMYAGFDRALRKGVKRIHVGQTATAFKSRMGCFSEPRHIYAKGVGFFMSRIFRYGSNFLVIKKPSNPPSDIFKRSR